LGRAWASLAEMFKEDLRDEPSLRRGLACLREGAQAKSATSLEMLAEWLQSGIGCVPDAAASIDVWRRLLELEPCNAAFALARAYESGNGIPQSLALASDHYRLARKAGHPEALKSLRRLGAEQ
jgi:TPR repeat protein